MYLTQTPQVSKKPDNNIPKSHERENDSFRLANRYERSPEKEKNINIVSNRMNRDCVSREFSSNK